jgi:hypothetical protein
MKRQMYGACVVATALASLLVFSGAAQAGLLAYWPMSEGAGTSAADQSGNDVTASLAGTAAWTTDGRFGNAVLFDGYDGLVDCGKNSKLNLGTGDFTVSLWFKGGPALQGYTDWRWLVNYNGSDVGDGDNALVMAVLDAQKDPTHNWNLRSSMGGWFNDVSDTAGPQYATDAWYHVALTRSGDTVNTYVNGALAGSATSSAAIGISDYGLRLGGMNTGYGPGSINGAIDDVAVWNQALTATEIAGLASGSLTPLGIPEPSTLTLIMVGMLGLLAYARKRRK